MPHATMKHVKTKVHFHNHSKHDCLIQQATTQYPFTVSDVVRKNGGQKDFVLKDNLADGTYDYEVVHTNDIRSITVPSVDITEDIN